MFMDFLSTDVKLFLPELSRKISIKNEKPKAQESQCLMVPEDLGTKQE